MYAAIEKSLLQFFAEPQADARRVFHGRGQHFVGLEHLCIDWFKPVLLLTAYSPVQNVIALLDAVQSADSLMQIRSVILQKRYERNAPSDLLLGEPIEDLVVREGDLVFEVHPGKQQNAGLFLDMRLLREWLQANCRDKNVLNLFAYTCSLSVAALAGGAATVTNVDMSKTSIRWGEKNHQLNRQDLRCVRSIPYKLFTSWGRIKQYGRYDLVIIDPPSRQRGSFDVEKNYAGVLKKLCQLCNPGADIIAALNSPFLESEYLIELFAAHVPDASFVDFIAPAPEFADKYPEKGLKICRFKLL